MSLFDSQAPIFEVSVSRSGPDVLQITWKTNPPDLPISIFHGTTPDTIDRRIPFNQTENKTALSVSRLDPSVPHYFKLISATGRAVIVGERRLPLEGTVNSRDLGGYETADGHRVKWGNIFRSDHLARLTDSDISFIQNMKIQSVCDFRTRAEVRNRPDRYPPDNRDTYFHLPVNHLKYEPTLLFEKLKNGDASWLTPDFLIAGYRLNIDQFGPAWGRVFKLMADPAHLPVLFHCTGGKDRAGTCAALILLALGVPEDTVIYDYGLSNIYIADVVDQIYAQFDIDAEYREKISPYFSAPQYCIEAMISHLNEKYGSVVTYLKSKAGVPAEMLQKIKAQLLE